MSRLVQLLDKSTGRVVAAWKRGGVAIRRVDTLFAWLLWEAATKWQGLGLLPRLRLSGRGWSLLHVEVLHRGSAHAPLELY